MSNRTSRRWSTRRLRCRASRRKSIAAQSTTRKRRRFSRWIITGPAIAAMPATRNVVLTNGLRNEGSKRTPRGAREGRRESEKENGVMEKKGVMEYWSDGVLFLVLGSWL